MSAARLIPTTISARTPTSGLVDLRRVDASDGPGLGHFVPPASGSTLCGIDLASSRPVAIVRCPRCLALAMPGRPVDQEPGT
jgi:hypothetical protein